MRILVPVKRVMDPYVSIQFDRINRCIKTDNMKMTLNPFDEIALEEALRFKESHPEKEVRVTVLSIGQATSQETLRYALAFGADDAIHIDTDISWQPLSIARIISFIVREEAIDWVIMGKLAIDGEHNQTGQMLSALLDWPQMTSVSELSYKDEVLTVCQEIDTGLERLSCRLPAVVTVDLHLNKPRYPTLPNIMKSKSKLLRSVQLSEMNLPLPEDLSVQSIDPPPSRGAGIRVETVEELVTYLRYKEQII